MKGQVAWTERCAPPASPWVAGGLDVPFPWRSTNFPGGLLTSFPPQRRGSYFCPTLGWAYLKVREVRQRDQEGLKPKGKGLCEAFPGLLAGGPFSLGRMRHKMYLSETSCVLFLSFSLLPFSSFSLSLFLSSSPLLSPSFFLLSLSPSFHPSPLFLPSLPLSLSFLSFFFQ